MVRSFSGMCKALGLNPDTGVVERHRKGKVGGGDGEMEEEMGKDRA